MSNSNELSGLRVAVLATEGFEQDELFKPAEALRAAGATVTVVAPQDGELQGFVHHDRGKSVAVDLVLDRAEPDAFDALVLPGGALNADQLRAVPEAVAFAKSFFDAGKPVGAICHAAWTLVESGAVRGRTMTSWPSIATDLKNAGASWVNREVVVDANFVTSRKPDDIPAFNRELIALLAKAKNDRLARAR